MSLRLRLALLIAVMITGALLAQGFLGYLNFRQTASRDINNDLQTYLATLAHDRAEGDAPTYLPNENGIRARLVKDGRVVQEYGGPFPSEDGLDGDDHWRTQQIAVPDLGAGAILQASLPLRTYRQGLNAYLTTVTFSVALMSLIGAAVALLVSRGVLRPLGDLLGAAERVSASGRLDERVAEPRDTGEIARLARSFNTMLGRLSAFRRREVEFVRHAAHEFRTPLAALRAQVDANAQGWISDAELIETVDQQVERLTALTEALLLLSRENLAAREDFDLAALCRDLAGQHQAAYHGPASALFAGSPALLTQVLSNLLLNAHKYAPGAPVCVELSVSAEQFRLSVSDAGPGIPAQALPQALEPFYRVPGTRQSGTGLGLAVVQRVAEAHGGTVQLCPLSPQGLSVQLALPRMLPLA